MIELPLPPTTSHQAGQYREVVKMLATCDRTPVQRGPVAVTVRIYRDRRSGSLPAWLPALLAGCQGVFFEHYGQIRELHAYLADDRERPRVEVEISDCRCGEGGQKLHMRSEE